MPAHLRVRSLSPVLSFVLLVCALYANAALAAPSITLSKRTGPPTTKIQVSGSGFEPNVGVDIFFDTKDEALVVTNNKGEFHNAAIHAPRSAHPGEHWVTALERNNDKGDQEPFVIQTDWPQFRFDATHKGVNPYENVLDRRTVAGLALAWTSLEGSQVESSPSVANGVAYFSAADGTVSAVTANKGRLLWSQEFISNTTGLSVVNNTVYVGSDGQYFSAANAETGAVRWQYPTGVDQGSPVIVDRVAYVGSVPFGDTLYSLNADTGTLLWSSQVNGGSESSPAVVNGVLYIGSYSGNLYAVDSNTGNLLWSYQTGNFVFSSPAVSDGAVFFGSEDDNVYALNAKNGVLIWKYATGNAVDSSPAVSGGVVYVGSVDNNLYALKASTGTLLWKYVTGGPIGSSPAVANGVVYFGSSDGNFYALDASNGTLLWRYVSGDLVQSSPAIADGMVYVGSRNGNLYAFGLPSDDALEEGSTHRPKFSNLHPDLTLQPFRSAARP